MIVRRTLSLIAVAFVIMVGVAAPAGATDGYPITGGTGGTNVEGTKTGETYSGTTTGVRGTGVGNTGVGGAGLARTGGDLGTLWAGLGLLVAGGVIVTVSRNRRKVVTA